MGGKQQKNQRLLAFMAESRDEVPTAASGGTEPSVAKAHAQVDPGVLERRGHGERVGQSNGRGNAARRSSFALAQQPDAGRLGPGVAATRPSLRTLRGRL